MMVVGAELLVDWLKHAFITKFNEINSEVYKGKFERKIYHSKYSYLEASLKNYPLIFFPESTTFRFHHYHLI